MRRALNPLIFGFLFIFFEVSYFKILSFFGGSYFNYSFFCFLSLFIGFALGSRVSKLNNKFLLILIFLINAVLFFFFDEMPMIFQSLGAASSYLISFSVLMIQGLYLGNVFPKILEEAESKKRFFILDGVGGVLGVIFFEFFIYSKLGISSSFLFIIALNLFFFNLSKEKSIGGRVSKTLLSLGLITGLVQYVVFALSLMIFSKSFFVEPLVLLVSVAGLSLGSLIFSSRFSINTFSKILAGAIFVFPLVITELSGQVSWISFEWVCLVYFMAALGLMSVVGGLFPVYVANNKEDRRFDSLNYSLVLGNILGYTAGICLGSFFDEFAIISLILLLLVGMSLLQDRKLPLVLTVFFIVSINNNFMTVINFSKKDLEVAKIEKSFRTFGGVSAIYAGKNRFNKKERRIFQFGYSAISLDEAREDKISKVALDYAVDNKRCLVIGAGSGLTAGTVANKCQMTDLVDIDPTTEGMLEYLSKYNKNVLQKVNFYNQDAIVFLTKQRPYDLIILTADPVYHASAEKLYTQEFFGRAKKHLKKDGVFVFWLDKTVNSFNQKVIINTAAGVFKHQKGVFESKEGFAGDYSFYINSKTKLKDLDQESEFDIELDRNITPNSWKKSNLNRYIFFSGEDDAANYKR